MAFDFGYATIANGEELTWHYWFGGDGSQEYGDDRGAQYCMVHPLYAGGALYETRQGKEQSDTQMHHEPNAQVVYRYYVTVKCEARYDMAFKFQGGGLI